MNKPNPDPRYADDVLAWEYDQRQPSPYPGELEWYLKYIGQSGGPVLELTCGSGRLTVPMAQAGYEIDGVDSSQVMLRRLTEKLQVCSETVQRKVRTFCADISEYMPDLRYGIVILPYNSLQYLEMKEHGAALFSRVSTYLLPGGLFLFTLRRLNMADYANGKERTIDWTDKPVIDEKRRISVASRVVSSFDPVINRIANHRTYIIRQGDGSERTINFTTYAPVIEVKEYVRMLEVVKFKIKVFSGYEGLPDDGVSREINFVCQKPTSKT
jgi:SAM-dependent methyltransferase